MWTWSSTPVYKGCKYHHSITYANTYLHFLYMYFYVFSPCVVLLIWVWLTLLTLHWAPTLWAAQNKHLLITVSNRLSHTQSMWIITLCSHWWKSIKGKHLFILLNSHALWIIVVSLLVVFFLCALYVQGPRLYFWSASFVNFSSLVSFWVSHLTPLWTLSVCDTEPSRGVTCTRYRLGFSPRTPSYATCKY